MKKEWVEPRIEVQKFTPNEYVAACWVFTETSTVITTHVSGGVLTDGRTDRPTSWQGPDKGFTDDHFDFLNASDADIVPAGGGTGWYSNTMDQNIISIHPQSPGKPTKFTGDDYEKGAVLKAIATAKEKQKETENVQDHASEGKNIRRPKPVISTKILDIGEIGSLVDIEHNPKVKESEAYMQWAKIHNLQEQSKTFNYMSEHGLLNGTQLDEELAALQTAYDQAKAEVKETEKRLKEVNRSLRLLGQYYRTRKIYQSYRRCSNKKSYREEHRSELELYDAAVKELRSIYSDGKFPPIQDLKKEKSKLMEQKTDQYEVYQGIRSKWMDVAKIVRNRDSFLKKQREQERTESSKG